MDTPEIDLSAMARPDRSAGLGGRLAPRRPAPPAPAPQTPPPAQEPASESPAAPPASTDQDTTPSPAPAAASTAGRGSGDLRRRSPRAAGPDSDGRLVIAIPPGLRDRARAAAASRGLTYADIALEAVEAVHDQLPELVERHRQPDPETRGRGLFEHRPRQRRASEATVQITIRGLNAHDRGVLDQLVEGSGAHTLTELLTVALDAHLPVRPRSMR